jgi:hypothetical protein
MAPNEPKSAAPDEPKSRMQSEPDGILGNLPSEPTDRAERTEIAMTKRSQWWSG